MEGVVTVEVVTTVESTAQVFAGSRCTEQFCPVALADSIHGLVVTKGEPHLTTRAGKCIGEYRIIEHTLVAV